MTFVDFMEGVTQGGATAGSMGIAFVLWKVYEQWSANRAAERDHKKHTHAAITPSNGIGHHKKCDFDMDMRDKTQALYRLNDPTNPDSVPGKLHDLGLKMEKQTDVLLSIERKIGSEVAPHE